MRLFLLLSMALLLNACGDNMEKEGEHFGPRPTLDESAMEQKIEDALFH